MDEISNNKNIGTYLTPLFSEKICDCAKFKNSQIVLSQGQVFNIQNNEISYPDNAEICISTVCVYYSCLGLTLPLTFKLCNQNYSFAVDGSGCSCTEITSTLPLKIQNLINDTISHK